MDPEREDWRRTGMFKLLRNYRRAQRSGRYELALPSSTSRSGREETLQQRDQMRKQIVREREA